MVEVLSLQCPSSAPALARLEAPRARGRATWRPATALGARASRHQSHRIYTAFGHSGTATEKLGEVRLYDALVRHRRRTHDASQATFFFTPLWEYTSWALGRCRGTTHTQRMAAAAEQLAASPYYQVSPSPSPKPNPIPNPNPNPNPSPNPNTTSVTGVETTSGARPPRRSMAPSSTSGCSR